MMMGKLKDVAVVFGAAAGLIGAPAAVDAAALTIGDAYYLGYINDGVPASEAAEVTYINSLLALTPGAAAAPCSLAATENCDRLNSTLDASLLPDAVTTGAVKDESKNNTGIDVTNWTYLLGKYDGPNFGSVVWYVGGLTGEYDIPAAAGSQPYGLSHYTLYNFTDPGPDPDPDPDPDPVPEPMSLVLLGLGMAGAAAARRRQTR